MHMAQVSLTYSQFLSDVSAHQVKTVTLTPDGPATGLLANGSRYSTVIPSQAGSPLLDRLQASGVKITADTAGPSFSSQVLSWLLLLSPILLFGWLWWRLSRGAAGQLQ